MLGGIGGRRRRGQQRIRWLDGITDSMAASLSELRAFVGAAEFIDGQVKIWLAPWTYSWCLKCGSFLELNSYTVETANSTYCQN